MVPLLIAVLALAVAAAGTAVVLRRVELEVRALGAAVAEAGALRAAGREVARAVADLARR